MLGPRAQSGETHNNDTLAANGSPQARQAQRRRIYGGEAASRRGMRLEPHQRKWA